MATTTVEAAMHSTPVPMSHEEAEEDFRIKDERRGGGKSVLYPLDDLKPPGHDRADRTTTTTALRTPTTNVSFLPTSTCRGTTHSSSHQDHHHHHHHQDARLLSSLSSSRGSSAASASFWPWREALAGAGAGALSRTLLAPVERIKLIQQVSSSSLSSWHLARQIYQEQGLLAFWRGNLAGVYRVAGTSALNFAAMEYYKQQLLLWMKRRRRRRRTTTTTASPLSSSTPSGAFLEGRSTALERLMRWLDPSSAGLSSSSTTDSDQREARLASFLAGGLAGATSTTLLYPLEFLRTRLALDMGTTNLPWSSSSTSSTPSTLSPRQYRGMGDVVCRIVQSPDGVTGLFHGYGVALVGSMFYRLLYLGGYDALKQEILYRRQPTPSATTTYAPVVSLSWGERFLTAQVVSLTAGTLSYPLDSVRRRLMLQAGQERPLYRHAGDCIRHVWRQEGVRGFYRGLGPNVVRSVGGALVLVAYDSLKDTLLPAPPQPSGHPIEK